MFYVHNNMFMKNMENKIGEAKESVVFSFASGSRFFVDLN